MTFADTMRKMCDVTKKKKERNMTGAQSYHLSSCELSFCIVYRCVKVCGTYVDEMERRFVLDVCVRIEMLPKKCCRTVVLCKIANFTHRKRNITLIDRYLSSCAVNIMDYSINRGTHLYFLLSVIAALFLGTLLQQLLNYREVQEKYTYHSAFFLVGRKWSLSPFKCA